MYIMDTLQKIDGKRDQEINKYNVPFYDRDVSTEAVSREATIPPPR